MIVLIDNPRPQKITQEDWDLYDLISSKIEEAQRIPAPRGGRPPLKFKISVNYDTAIKRWKGLAKKRIKELRKALNKITNSKKYKDFSQMGDSFKNTDTYYKAQQIVKKIVSLENLLKEEPDGTIGFSKFLTPIDMIIEFDDEKAGSGHSSFNKEMLFRVTTNDFNKERYKTLFVHELTHQKDPFLLRGQAGVKDVVGLILANIYSELYYGTTDAAKKGVVWAAIESELTARLAEWNFGISNDKHYVQLIVNDEIRRSRGFAGGITGDESFRLLERIVKHLNETFNISNLHSTKVGQTIKTDVDKGISILEKKRKFRKDAIKQEKEYSQYKDKHHSLIKDLKKIRKELRIGDKGVATGLAKRKFSSLTKTKKYVEEALESNQLLGLSSGDYERNNKIITLFSKSLLNRIREAKEQESFDKLVDESKILNIEYSYDPSSKDKHTKITLEDLIKAKKSFQNQYTRYLSMIYNIMVSNGIKFKYQPSFDTFKKVIESL